MAAIGIVQLIEIIYTWSVYTLVDISSINTLFKEKKCTYLLFLFDKKMYFEDAIRCLRVINSNCPLLYLKMKNV